MTATTHVYLIPGMFGFGKLAGYDYFAHLERGLAERYDAAGVPLHMEVIPAPATASIRRRAAVVAQEVARTLQEGKGPVHLLGHSTGGLDARLLLSPGAMLELSETERAWTHRVRSLVTLNCPHHGTPLAGYFTTVAGTRLLYALSLMTVTSLTLGRLPLTAFSGLVAAVGAVDEKLGVNSHLLEQLTDALLSVVGERGQGEIHSYLDNVRDDRGGIIQLMPEAMDLFNAAVHDSDDVRYGCVATASPAPGPRRVLSGLRSPYAAMQLAVYTTVHNVAGRAEPRYPYALPDLVTRQRMTRAIGREVGATAVDGIVPMLSMLWRELVWCGEADHLDVVGHFNGPGDPDPHVDWLASGAHFSRKHFASMMDAIVKFQLDDGGSAPPL